MEENTALVKNVTPEENFQDLYIKGGSPEIKSAYSSVAEQLLQPFFEKLHADNDQKLWYWNVLKMSSPPQSPH